MPDYGAANRYAFDDPNKWVTLSNVPLLDEHEMTDESGRPVARVDKPVLEQIAANNNERVVTTGDPATLILGHTSDDPRADEKPAKGFVVNYRVLPFKRDTKTGQVIYAIHGDFKVRPQNAHLLEEYPRRSVELWWNKKELDPIALLGGTSPERDLGVVIRKARLKHLALLGSSSPERDLGQTIRFSRHGAYTVESYQIETPARYAADKVGKVMGEFKNGTLHSGSKSGPKVTSRDQAVAIAMSEAGKAKKSRTGGDAMPKGYPPERAKYKENVDFKIDYDDAGLDTDDLGDYDPGDEDLQPDDAGGDAPADDPMVAKVFQSKQWKELSSKLDRILGALESEEEQLGGMGGPGMGPEGMGEEPPGEMPPPGAGPGMPPPGAGPEGPEGGEDYPPEEDDEAREFHGEKPVKMNSTNYAGLGNVNIPGFNMVKPAKPVETVVPKFSRRREAKTGEPMPATKNPELLRLQRRTEALEKQNRDLLLKYAMSEASQIVSGLVNEGILFGSTPEEEASARQETTEYLAHLGMQSEKDRDYEVEVIRKRYRRRPADPARPAFPGVARYARPAVSSGETEDPEDYEPRSPQEASDIADLIVLKKMSRAEAVKAVKKRNYQPFDIANPNM